MNNRLYIHIDADAFFASVEQCLHRELRGKPIVTGRDGSIGVALSYEAKALGVERATPIHMIREEFPTVQMVASDYYMYKIYSDRMISIIREYIPSIRRNSIDECSADITSMCDSFQEAEALATQVQQILNQKLMCTFSIGISTSPLLTKMASGMNKPAGLTMIDPATSTEYQQEYIKKVSGLGRKLCERLSKLGVLRISDFIERYPVIRKNFSIVTDDIYHQLLGRQSTRVREYALQKSMNRARSFKVTDNQDAVFGQLVLNFEHLMRKLRAQNMTCQRIYVTLGTADRNRRGSHLRLPSHSRDVDLLMAHMRIVFDDLCRAGEAYRYASVTLSGLRIQEVVQNDLFGEHEQQSSTESMYQTIDDLDSKFGKPVISIAATLSRPRNLGSHVDPKTYPITMRHQLLPGEEANRRIRYPFLGTV